MKRGDHTLEIRMRLCSCRILFLDIGIGMNESVVDL